MPSHVPRTMSGSIGADEPDANLTAQLRDHPRHWLVTGGAGFIGSSLVETLLGLGQRVTALDDFSTGQRENLEEVRQNVGAAAWRNFRLIEGDVRDPAQCARACASADVVLHQAAIASVARSMVNPHATHEVNGIGFLNMLIAARHANCRRFVYAGTSALYGDEPGPRGHRDSVIRLASPYAVTKYIGELYAEVFARCYGLSLVGLRYFNVFGPRQEGADSCSAVVPRWLLARLGGQRPHIFGDGLTSRDFTFVRDVVRANLLAADAMLPPDTHHVFDVGTGAGTSLLALLACMDRVLVDTGVVAPSELSPPVFEAFREADIRHSLAASDPRRRVPGYEPLHSLEDGIRRTVPWYAGRARNSGARTVVPA